MTTKPKTQKRVRSGVMPEATGKPRDRISLDELLEISRCMRMIELAARGLIFGPPIMDDRSETLFSISDAAKDARERVTRILDVAIKDAMRREPGE